MKIIDRAIEKIISRHRIIFIILLLVTVPLYYKSTQKKHDNHVKIYFDEDDRELNLYQRFQDTYGNEEFIVIAFKDRNIFTVRNITIVRDITERLKDLEGVQHIFSITNAMEAVSVRDEFVVRTIIPDGSLTQPVLDKSREKAVNNEVAAGSVISKDGTTTAVYVELKPDLGREKFIVLKKIKSISEGIAGGKARLYFGGGPFVAMEMNKLSSKDYATFTPLIFLVVFAVLIVLFRNFTVAVLCQVNILFILFWSIGFFVLAGEKFNIVNSIMGGVLLAISVADAIHLLTHFREEVNKGTGVTGALGNTLKNIWFPCLFTSITTSIGFLSFLSGSLRPVKILGIFTAMGIMAAFFLTMTFLPCSMLVFKKMIRIKKSEKRPEKGDGLLMNILLKTGSAAVRYSSVFGALLLVILVVTVFGIFRMKFETNTMNYLPDSNRIKSDMRFIEQNMTGTLPYEILIQAKDAAHDFTGSRGLRLLEKIQTDIMRDIPEFTAAYSIVDYFKTLNRAFNDNKKEFYTIPDVESDILDFYEIGDSEILKKVVSPDYTEASLSFRVVCGTNEEGKVIFGKISKYLRETTGKNYSYEVTGLATLFGDMGERLQESQLKSFLIAFIIIFFMLLFVCKNFAFTLLCMVPNIFPIAATLGFMGWFDIPIDVVTVMIASITLGIAVDDTIHFVVWFKRNINRGLDMKQAIMQTYRDVGKPIVITSLVLFLGFFMFVLGNIIPTRIFGALTAFSMLMALVADLIFLPAIMIIFKPEFRQ